MSRELSVNRDDEENNWGDDWGDEDVCKFGDNDNEMSDLRNDNKTDFEQMEYNAVVDMRNRMVDEVADLISQPNKEVPKKIMDDAGLYFSQTVVECGNDEVECRICDGDFKRNECHTVGCGHWFCFQCWEIYLTNKIQVEGYACVLTKCPSYKCLATVPDATFKEILCNKNPEKKEIFSRYERFVVRSFVEHSKSLRWCSAPKCERVIRARGNPKTVICSCGYKFCFKCNEEPHAPASCQQVATWKIKCRDESETAHWILANTRQCPKCNVRIEKNQGCNHMICRSCKYEFCWVCFGPWSEHSHDTGGFYKCNVFDPKKLKVQKENEAKAELDRYLHYYQRFHNHGQSKRFAEKIRDRNEIRMKELQEKNGSSSTFIDVQFLKTAMDQVFELRQVLQFTYVFAYYLEDAHEKLLFEFLQQQLEQSTEKLSELSESPLEKIDRALVVNYTRVTQQFMCNLLNGVEEGLTMNTPGNGEV